MVEQETKAKRQKLDAEIEEKEHDIETFERLLQEKRDARNKLIAEKQALESQTEEETDPKKKETKKVGEECKQQPTKVILPNGKYIIRFCVRDPDKLWFIWVATQRTGLPPDAKATRIRRESMENEKIRERHLPAEAFFELINSSADGTILLRHVETGRYAAVDRELTWLRNAREVSEEDEVISFFVRSNQFGRIGKDAEFELIAPTGNKADGVAIRSVGKDRYVLVSGDNFLHPFCKRISCAERFFFEPSVDKDRILDDYPSAADSDDDSQSGGGSEDSGEDENDKLKDEHANEKKKVNNGGKEGEKNDENA